MTKILTTQNAQITTASVEVKTLTISGKQVTLSVFRQLREERLVDPDGSLRGLPWGFVNYHPDKCAEARRHLHVVWQLGSDLYRSSVDRPDWYREHFFSEWSDGAIQSAYCANGHREPEWMMSARSWDSDTKSWDRVIRFFVDSIACETLLLPDRHHAESGECMSEADRRQTWEGLREEVAAEKERRARLNAQWEALSALPHLFIAV